jgi:hypothetical protein
VDAARFRFFTSGRTFASVAAARTVGATEPTRASTVTNLREATTIGACGANSRNADAAKSATPISPAAAPTIVSTLSPFTLR